MEILTHALLLLTLLTSQKGGSDAVLTVQGPEPGVVRLGDTSVVAIVVEGIAIGAEIEPPKAVLDLDIRVTGPSQLSQSFFDGKKMRTSVSQSWKLLLKPKKEGKFEIPPVLVKIGRETLSTPAIKLECVRDLTGSKYAFLEAQFSKKEYFAHEPARAVIRFGVDRSIRGNMLQLFNRPLGVEVQIEAPWLQEFPGGVAIDAPPGGRNDRQIDFVVNQSLAYAQPMGEVERGGRTFLVYEMERTWLPGKLGTLQLTAPLLRFRYATRFTTDFFGERVASDRQEAFVYGEPASLDILPIPEEGRPRSFSGAVGQFGVTADANPRQVKVGESVNLKITITGSGNLEFFEPPELEPLEGFHVFGKLDDKTRSSRIVTYHLAPLVESVKEIPAIEFTYFDTQPPSAYKTVKTAPIPLTVKPLPPGASLAPLADSNERRFTVGVDDIFDIVPLTEARADERQAPSAPFAVLTLAAPWLLAAAAFAWRRKLEHDRAHPDRVQARAAYARFKSSSGDAAAFTTYLAERMGCNEAVVVHDGLDQLLTSAGVPPELALRTSTALLTSVSARYAGGASPSVAAGLGEFAGLAYELEAAFSRATS